MGNREALLQAADRCLRSGGYSTTTARDLAAEAGTSLAAIGYHFGSKEALLNEALGVAFTGWLDRLGAVALAADGQPLGDAVTGLVAAVYDAIAEDRQLLAAFFDAVAHSMHSPPLREQLAAQYADMRRGVADLVAVIAPATAEHESTRVAVASLVMAIIDGLAVQHLLDPESLPAPEAVAKASSLLRAEPPKSSVRRPGSAKNSTQRRKAP